MTAVARSCTLRASTDSPYTRAANSPASAPSIWPSAACRAASALDEAGRHSACGRFAFSHWRHWAWACGWPLTTLIPARSVPSRPSSANATGSRISVRMISARPVASSSRVAVTAPSTEFSSGTTPRSVTPSRTASSVAMIVGNGTASAWSSV